MTSVLVICGHVGITQLTAAGLRSCRLVDELRRGTGTRGEQAWTGNVGALLADALKARGVDAIASDAIYDAATYAKHYDLILALHLQRDRPSSRAFASAPAAIGVCDGSPYISAAARALSQKWVDRFHNEYPVVTGIPTTPGDVSANMEHLYDWDYPELETPCAIAECGNADVDAPVLYEAGGAPRVVRALALITLEYLEADLGAALTPVTLPPPAIPLEPFPLSTFPVLGAWSGDVRALEAAVQSYSEGRAPAGFGSVVADYAAEIGVRPDVAIAQAMHETGRFRFDGVDPVFSAKPDWCNYGGIKTTDGTATARFITMSAGIKALLAHLSWYANQAHSAPWCSAGVDPRHSNVHPFTLHTLADYGGGVWNTSARPGYGSAIARHLAEIRSRVAAYVAPAPPPIVDKLAEAKRLATQIVGL